MADQMTLLERAALATFVAGLGRDEPTAVQHARAVLIAAGFPPEALDQPAGAWVVVPRHVNDWEISFAAAEWMGSWWVDRIGPYSRDVAACGPFAGREQAERAAAEFTAKNHASRPGAAKGDLAGGGDG